jgi:hypothetical protein
VCLFPELPRYTQGVDFMLVPPPNFVAGLVQLPMVATAKRHRKLVADFEAQGSRLRKAQVMRITGLPAADDTGLGGNEAKM